MGDDLEVEDIELGDDKDLAADVDDGIPEEDEEGLESDDDEDRIEGLDMEEDTDREFESVPSQTCGQLTFYFDRTNVHSPTILPIIDGETDEGLRRPSTQYASSCYRNQRS